MPIEIRHYATNDVLYRGDHRTVAHALECAVAARIDLSGANLPSADLRKAQLQGALLNDAWMPKVDLEEANLVGAHLRGVNFYDANLIGAKLERADLSGADLVGANFREALLSEANLSGADAAYARMTIACLRGAVLTKANLHGVELSCADLERADLRDTDLSGVCLRNAELRGVNPDRVKADYYDILQAAPGEVHGILRALREGGIDGTCYEGACACLLGTIAKLRGVKYNEMETIRPDANRPAEAFFTAIKRGDTPRSNGAAALIEEWTVEWLRDNPSPERRGAG